MGKSPPNVSSSPPSHGAGSYPSGPAAPKTVDDIAHTQPSHAPQGAAEKRAGGKVTSTHVDVPGPLGAAKSNPPSPASQAGTPASRLQSRYQRDNQITKANGKRID